MRILIDVVAAVRSFGESLFLTNGQSLGSLGGSRRAGMAGMKSIRPKPLWRRSWFALAQWRRPEGSIV